MSITPKQLARVMAALGRKKTERKADASRANGRKGGRPKGSKNKPKSPPEK